MWRLNQWNCSTAELRELIEACLEMGITTFDHADIYGGYTCERLFGDVLEEAPELRDRIRLISKCGIKAVAENRPQHQLPHYDSSRPHIIASVEQSLQNLRTDYLDLLLIHRPDFLMDVDEVAEAFTTLQQTDKVRHFGVSNFLPHQFELLESRLDVPLVTNQVEFSVMNMDHLFDGTLDQCQKERIVPMVWSPFGGGDMFTADTQQTIRVRQALRQVGDELGGLTIDQTALAWIMTHPTNPVPILGTGRLERLRRAADVADRELDRQQWYRIWSASMGQPVP